MKRIKKHKWIWIVGAIVVIGGLGIFLLSRARATSAVIEGDIGETAVVGIGDLSESATASGQVKAQRHAALSLAGSGVVEKVNVSVGDLVSAGDVLIQLDTAALQRAVTSAEQDVIIAEANLAKLLAGSSTEELASSEAAVNSAQTNLESLQSGPTAEEIAASEAAVNAAQANIWAASGNVQAANTVSNADILAAEIDLETAQDAQQAAHNRWVRLANCSENGDGTHTCTPKEDNDAMDAVSEDVRAANAQVAIAQAKLDEFRNPDANSVASSQAGWSSAAAGYDAAVARHEALLLGASESEIVAAEAELASAEAELEHLMSGPSDADRKIYETRLDQANLALEEAFLALEEASLVAPFDGIITAIEANEGEIASGVVAEILDKQSLEVILNVDEIDVGRLEIGQPAILTMETWPNDEIASEITAIAPAASDSGNGVSTYAVHLALDRTELPILVGMTANADLVTDVGEGVLLVPNEAVTADRENRTYKVNVVRTNTSGDVSVVPVDVTIGLKDKDFTQILGGLVEGDTVVLSKFTAPTQSFGQGRGGNGDGGPFGG